MIYRGCAYIVAGYCYCGNASHDTVRLNQQNERDEPFKHLSIALGIIIKYTMTMIYIALFDTLYKCVCACVYIFGSYF